MLFMHLDPGLIFSSKIFCSMFYFFSFTKFKLFTKPELRILIKLHKTYCPCFCVLCGADNLKSVRNNIKWQKHKISLHSKCFVAIVKTAPIKVIMLTFNLRHFIHFFYWIRKNKLNWQLWPTFSADRENRILKQWTTIHRQRRKAHIWILLN